MSQYYDVPFSTCVTHPTKTREFTAQNADESPAQRLPLREEVIASPISPPFTNDTENRLTAEDHDRDTLDLDTSACITSTVVDEGDPNL